MIRLFDNVIVRRYLKTRTKLMLPSLIKAFMEQDASRYSPTVWLNLYTLPHTTYSKRHLVRIACKDLIPVAAAINRDRLYPLDARELQSVRHDCILYFLWLFDELLIPNNSVEYHSVKSTISSLIDTR